MPFEKLSPIENMVPRGNLHTPENQETDIEKEAMDDLNDLGLSWDYLKEKLTLDIGAGPAIITETAKKKGVKVISLDKNPEMWTERNAKLPSTLYVKASAEQLPFQDGVFDLIISHAGPVTNTPEKKDVAKTLKEAEQVLKNEGEIRFGPGNLNANIFTSEELFTPEEKKLFTTEQRIDRIGEKAIEFLKSINPNIKRVLIKNPSYNYPSKTFYSLKKVSKKAENK